MCDEPEVYGIFTALIRIKSTNHNLMLNKLTFSFKFLHCLPFLALALLNGCVSMSTMQTGRTAGKGGAEVNLGASVVKLEALVDVDSTELNGGLVEGDFRYGITEKLDLGLKISLLGTSGIYGKYQLIGDRTSKFALSAGLGAGYLAIESGADDNKTKSTIVDLYVPIYASVHPTEWLAIYAAPRYNLRFGSESSSWYGGTGGIRLGKRFGGFFEYSWMDSDVAIKPLRQITGGISIGFGG